MCLLLNPISHSSFEKHNLSARCADYTNKDDNFARVGDPHPEQEEGRGGSVLGQFVQHGTAAVGWQPI